MHSSYLPSAPNCQPNCSEPVSPRKLKSAQLSAYGILSIWPFPAYRSTPCQLRPGKYPFTPGSATSSSNMGVKCGSNWNDLGALPCILQVNFLGWNLNFGL